MQRGIIQLTQANLEFLIQTQASLASSQPLTWQKLEAAYQSLGGEQDTQVAAEAASNVPTSQVLLSFEEGEYLLDQLPPPTPHDSVPLREVRASLQNFLSSL